jgi:hypothetical protein
VLIEAIHLPIAFASVDSLPQLFALKVIDASVGEGEVVLVAKW